MGKRGHFTLHFTDKDFKLKLWKEHSLITTQLRCVVEQSQYGQMLTATMHGCSVHHYIDNCDIIVNGDATPIVGRAIKQWDETYLSHWMKPTCIHIVWIRSQLTFSIAKPKNILGHLLNIIFYPLQSRNGHLTKVSVTICPKGIQVIRLSDRTILLDVPMDRWAN